MHSITEAHISFDDTPSAINLEAAVSGPEKLICPSLQDDGRLTKFIRTK
jgi:hypothetical protein